MSTVDNNNINDGASNVGVIDKKRESLPGLPDSPGVYLFKENETYVYIGKATNLRDRVRSYFSADLKQVRGGLVQRAIDKADQIEWRSTDSALEALILEANLIKKYKPTGNTSLVDDKSYNYVVFTDEDFPRVFTVRAHDMSMKYDPDEFKYTFGPYTSGNSVKRALRLIRKIFPFRREKDPVVRKSRHSPMNEQLGLVPVDLEANKREYQRLINNLRLFFEGKKSQLVKDLNRDMKLAAKDMRFEEAAKIRNTIGALRHINDTTLINEEFISGTSEAKDKLVIESYDVAHTMGENMVGVMIVMEDDLFNKSRYRKFKIKRYKRSNDPGALKEMLERRLNHPEWPLPNLFVVDGGKAQYNAFAKVLDQAGIQVPIIGVTKGVGHKPKGFQGDPEVVRKFEGEILRSNAEAHRFAISWHRAKQRKKRFDV